ncbi:Glycosyl transferase, group 2 family [hydrothermal vent metagenome]|uniref:Glycosyl transferase, group 2 family n=1 Tax=hydrothermal vent metagenome TaxID=652676 RepID=A0A3B1C512_9ZZZZ
MAPQLISIIIPAWREKDIGRVVRCLDGAPDVELIVALAGEDEKIAQPDQVKVAISAKGRALQMNAGALIASGAILLFLHADTFISPQSLTNVRKALGPPDVAGGSYRLKIDSNNLWLKLVSAVANLRSRVLGLPYGDQAIFLRRKTFEEIGGYRATPILEDVLLVEAIKKIGSLALIDDYAVTSPRKWLRDGMVRNTARNWAIMAAYLLGATPDKLDKWFTGR